MFKSEKAGDHMKSVMLIVGLTVMLDQLPQAVAADPLKVAKELANTKFKDWTYGGNEKKKQVDCVQFVLPTVEEVTQSSLNAELKRRLLISNLSAEEQKPEKLAELIKANDVRTKGLQSALVSAKLAVAVAPAEAKPGDLIQYWMQQDDGTWFGHSGILDEVFTSNGKSSATIFGSHRSQNGIGVSKFKLSLTGDPEQRRIYLARLK